MALFDTLGHNWLDLVVAGIVGLFGAGGLNALLKNRKEGSKILVDAAQGAVIIQTTVIDNLRDELKSQKENSEKESAELRAEIAELRTHMAELNTLRARVRELEHSNEELKAENTMLASQVRALTKVVRDNELKAEARDGH
jgi:flagellar motility protein MotE (MotC chaperone)